MVEALCILDDLFNYIGLLDSGEGVVFGKFELLPCVHLFSIFNCLAMHEDEYREGVIFITGDLGSSLNYTVDLVWPVRLISYVILHTRVNNLVGWLELLDY